MNRIFSSVFAFAVGLVGCQAAADVYVDSMYTQGDNDGTKSHPYLTIKEGCDAAYPGDAVYVRGGGREYFFADCNGSAALAKTGGRLLGCDDDWKVVTDSVATNDMPVIAISDAYAEDSYRKSAGSEKWAAPIAVSASGCTISGFRATFGADSYRKKNRGGEGLIAIAGGVSGTTVENCHFEMTGDAGTSDGVGVHGLVSGVYAHGAAAAQVKDTLIRGCFIRMARYGASVCALYNLHGGTRFEGNLVTNLETLYAGSNQGVKNIDFHVVSNVFLNCCNQTADGAKTWLFDADGEYAPNSGEIAYNRFIRDDFDTVGYYLFQHGDDVQGHGNWTGDVRIHHNTVVGYDIAFESPDKGGSGAPGTTWKPYIFDNLIVDTGYVFSESANARWNGDNASSFLPGSVFKGNAVQVNKALLTGSASQQAWYSVANLQGWNEKLTLSASDPLRFINTTDPRSGSYYRQRVADDTAWVDDSAWEGDVPGQYPKYIGAVPPLRRGFAIRVR